jgi:hypothetical protein
MWGRKGELGSLGGNDGGRVGCGDSGLNEDYQWATPLMHCLVYRCRKHSQTDCSRKMGAILVEDG